MSDRLADLLRAAATDTPAEQYALNERDYRARRAGLDFDDQLAHVPGHRADWRTTASTESLLAVVAAHQLDTLGHCALCGDEWVCRPRLQAASELRARGVERPLPPDGAEVGD